MAPQVIHRLLDDDPFRPFRMFMVDGSTFDVLDTGDAFSTPLHVAVGLDPDDGGSYQRSIYLSPTHVVRIEVLKWPPEGLRKTI